MTSEPFLIPNSGYQMRDHRFAKTANRSIVGIMNEFTYLAEAPLRAISRVRGRLAARRAMQRPGSPDR